LSTIRAQAELAYDKNGSSYGKNPFSLGPCKQIAGTLFADSEIVSLLNNTTEKNMSLATCVSSGTVGKVTSYAVSSTAARRSRVLVWVCG